ncbi:YD repeat-containing protein [Dyadobacter soli]|uniref:YD repeat-containing protein n=1 Tax=Dyadobacter soli TaxID=659014 RepID=A0A1G7SYA3_9BACT|nr:hypothetical protein [Dyadobacter soli]SDG27744.1 YD repeat-containing protein [Dyadobacter soli]
MRRIPGRLLSCLCICITLWACDNADYSLDKAIPRLQTPLENIGSFRTKWRKSQHIETVFYDRQNRVAESFNFGRSSWKTLNFYENDRLAKTISYAHSDSDESNTATVDTVWFEYDESGKKVTETHRQGRLHANGSMQYPGAYKLFWEYTAAGDTILKKWEGKYELLPANIINVNRWERDEKQRITSHYKLYVLNGPADTIDHFTRRYAYDAQGRLKQVWFERMYLGKFYIPHGPDTIAYTYDAQNRLLTERHRYTTDMRNKQEVDTTQLSEADREYVRFSRSHFFKGNGYTTSNDRLDIFEYRYETFDPEKHGQLEIP